MLILLIQIWNNKYLYYSNYMDTNKPLSVMRASLAGKQRTHAVKIYGSIDQITVVLSHEPVHLVLEGTI